MPTAALKKISMLVQTLAPDAEAVSAVCAELAGAIGGSVALVDNRGKQLAQSGEALRFRESVDGLYIDSRLADRLRAFDSEVTVFDTPFDEERGHTLVLPLSVMGERAATLVARKDTHFSENETVLAEAAGAVVLLMISCMSALEASERRRVSSAVKLAIGSLSFSELAAVVHIFREIGGEGLIVAVRVADKLRIARSVVVNALRKLEGAGIIETRSLGVKGTYIKVLNPVLTEELYKMKG